MHIANHKKITLTDVTITNYKSKSLIKAWTEGEVEITNLTCDVNKENYVIKAEEEFICQPI